MDGAQANVRWQEWLPLQWQPGPGEPDGERQRQLNLHLLRAAAALEEHAPEPADEKDPQQAERQRLHDKLNLVLEIMGQLLALSRPAPPARSICLTPEGAFWEAPATELPPEGQGGVLCLHLHPCVPQPLRLRGTVRAVEQGADGKGTVQVTFDPPGDAVAAALERHVFRHHRRAVAESRRAQSA